MHFFDHKVHPSSPNALRLKQFAQTIDAQITNNKLKVLNPPTYQALKSLKQELNAETQMMEDLIDQPIIQIITDHGSIYTTTPYEEQKNNQLTLATREELEQYYISLAHVVLERKKSTCVGFAAVTLYFAKELSENKVYQDINVHICSLKQYHHVFIKFTLPGEPQALYYDPWYQRCKKNGNPEHPFLFKQQREAMHKIVDELGGINLHEIVQVQAYNPKTRKLASGLLANLQQDEFSYEMLYSLNEEQKPTLGCCIS